jgi:hypothetical protein
VGWTGEATILRKVTAYAIRIGLGILAFAVVFVPTLGTALILGVRQRPVSIAQVLPLLEREVQSRTGATVSAKGAFLAWNESRRRLAIRLTEVAISGTPGSVTHLPLVDLSYRLRALLRGIVLPTAVSIYHPRLVLTRDAEGDLSVSLGGHGEAAAAAPAEAHPAFDLRAVLAPLMASDFRYLDFIDIVGAEATVVDISQGRHYGIPRLDAGFERTTGGLTAELNFETLIGGVASAFSIDAAFDVTPVEIRLTAAFDNVVPGLFADEFATLAAAKGVNLPISGRISARLRPEDITRIALADLAKAEARGEIVGGAGAVQAPSPIGLSYPVRGFRLKGDYDGRAGQATLETLHLDLADAALSAQATAAWVPSPAEGDAAGHAIVVKSTLRLTDTALDCFERYWPEGIAPPARSWLVENLKDGRVEESRFDAELRGTDIDTLDVTAFAGEASMKDASVHYLRPMPPIVGAAGRIVFGLKEIDVFPESGHVGNLVVQPGGKVRFTGLDEFDQYADIDAEIEGPVREALELLDREPLKLLHGLGSVDPKTISGNGKTHLTMRFPLLLDLRLADMTVKARSSLSEVTIKNVIPRRTLTEGVLDLAVDLDSLEVSGDGKINGVPLRLGWEERFSGPGTRTRYTLSGSIDDAGRAALGLDFIPFTDPYMRGPVGGDAVATVDRQGRMSLGVQMDLTQAAMEVPGMGWRKLQGGPASGTASIRFDKGRLLDIPQYRVVAGDGFEVSGNAKAAADGRISHLAFREIRMGRSRLAGGMDFASDGRIDASLTGEVLDLQPLVGDSGWKAFVDDDDDADKPETVPPVTLNLAADRVWVSEEGLMTKVAATLRRAADNTWTGNLSGRLTGDKTAAIDVVRGDGEVRRLAITSDDAGAFLTAFDFTRSIRGGAFGLDGSIPKKGPISGKARIDNFSVVKAPILARLVSVASITGIADLLNGAGVSFWYLDAPFSLEHGVATLTDLRAAGPSFGIATNGMVDTDTDAVSLKGTIIPFNVVNRVITDIPLIGQILGGKDGGLFAMNYTIAGTLDEPDVSVNPLSALVPGGVQSLFFPKEQQPSAPPAP